jgi:hypothetical protein
MKSSVGIQGSTVVMLFAEGERGFGQRAPGLRPFGAANDNGPPEPSRTVTVRRKLEKSGVAIKIKVPVEEFIGVAVSTAISPEGILTSAIELVHGDPELNYQVFSETGNGHVVAEWQNWGKKLRLPLYIKSGDGVLLPYSQTVDGVMLGQTTDRRRLAAEASRRPRFLNRRKPGNLEV